MQRTGLHHAALAALHVDFVAQHDEREVVRVTGTGLRRARTSVSDHRDSRARNKETPLQQHQLGIERYLYQEFISPGVQVVERLLRVHVIHQDAAVRPAVEGNPKTLKALLARCVPNLRARWEHEQIGAALKCLVLTNHILAREAVR